MGGSSTSRAKNANDKWARRVHSERLRAQKTTRPNVLFPGGSDDSPTEWYPTCSPGPSRARRLAVADGAVFRARFRHTTPAAISNIFGVAARVFGTP